ncbi:MAG: hypothetical protein V3T86_08975 [Planctomycetota bacterium]
MTDAPEPGGHGNEVLLEPADREVLHRLRKDSRTDPDEAPTWRAAKGPLAFAITGLILIAWDFSQGRRPSFVAGLALGGGVLSIVLQLPVASYLYRCRRLIRFADGRGAYRDDA